MQLGVKSEESLELGKKNGKNVIMDKCPKMEHSRLSGALGLAGFNSNLVSSKRNVSNLALHFFVSYQKKVKSNQKKR